MNKKYYDKAYANFASHAGTPEALAYINVLYREAIAGKRISPDSLALARRLLKLRP